LWQWASSKTANRNPVPFLAEVPEAFGSLQLFAAATLATFPGCIKCDYIGGGELVEVDITLVFGKGRKLRGERSILWHRRWPGVARRATVQVRCYNVSNRDAFGVHGRRRWDGSSLCNLSAVPGASYGAGLVPVGSLRGSADELADHVILGFPLSH